jgi:hypothetical protein
MKLAKILIQMNGNKILLDSNIVIEVFSGNNQSLQKLMSCPHFTFLFLFLVSCILE